MAKISGADCGSVELLYYFDLNTILTLPDANHARDRAHGPHPRAAPPAMDGPIFALRGKLEVPKAGGVGAI